MSLQTSRIRFRQAAVGAYVLWLVAVVLFVLGRYTGFPTLEAARTGTVVGAGVFALVGAVGIGRRGVERLRERYR
jgi:uncharacterized membrane protein